MNKTERMYALVEELRAIAPRARSSSWLARRFEVSTRTIERDLAALQQAGVPVWATNGRRGGYALDARMTLPPLNFTPSEAAELVGRIRVPEPAPELPTGQVPATVVGALGDRRVLEIDYVDRLGRSTSRCVEPTGLFTVDGHWYLVAWCRLRYGHRAFRLDRIRLATVRIENAPDRSDADWDCDVPVPFASSRSRHDRQPVPPPRRHRGARFSATSSSAASCIR